MISKPSKFLQALILIGICCCLAPLAQAQVVEKVKEPNVLISLQGQTVESGSDWITVTDTGRKTGLIHIKQVRGDKAVAQILKGVVTVGQTLTPRPAPKNRFGDEPAPVTGTDGSSNVVITKKTRRAGVSFGYAMDSMSIPANNQASTYPTTVSLSGTAFQIQGFYYYQATPKLILRFAAGLDGFNGSAGISSAANGQGALGTSINKDGSSTSTLSVSSLGLSGEAMWALYQKGLSQLWVGGSYTFDYVMSLSSNLYSLTSPSFTNAISPGIGYDIGATKTFFIPLALHYDYFLAGSGISQSAIRISVGAGWVF